MHLLASISSLPSEILIFSSKSLQIGHSLLLGYSESSFATKSFSWIVFLLFDTILKCSRLDCIDSLANSSNLLLIRVVGILYTELLDFELP